LVGFTPIDWATVFHYLMAFLAGSGLTGIFTVNGHVQSQQQRVSSLRSLSYCLPCQKGFAVRFCRRTAPLDRDKRLAIPSSISLDNFFSPALRPGIYADRAIAVKSTSSSKVTRREHSELTLVRTARHVLPLFLQIRQLTAHQFALSPCRVWFLRSDEQQIRLMYHLTI
jgi:hypothetical protein